MLQLEIAFLDHPKRSRCNAFDLIEMRVVCRDKNIKSSMIDVDVGDQRATISLSRASNNLLNPSEAKVVWLTQANYANDNHNKNDNANANDNLMLVIMLLLMIMVFLDTLLFPVSPWTLRAPDQLVRYLCPSVGLVLGGQTCTLWKELCARQTEFIARIFFKWAFLKVKKTRPAHVGKSNYFVKQGNG
jgi:hypothetical protein